MFPEGNFQVFHVLDLLGMYVCTYTPHSSQTPPPCPPGIIIFWNYLTGMLLDLNQGKMGGFFTLIYAEKVVSNPSQSPSRPQLQLDLVSSSFLLQLSTQVISQSSQGFATKHPFSFHQSTSLVLLSKSIGNTRSFTLHPLQRFLRQLALQPISRALSLRSFPIP